MDPEDEGVQMHLLHDYTRSAKSQTIYKLLWEYIQTRRFENFKCLLEQNLDKESPGIDVNHAYLKNLGKTCLDAAIEKDLPEFVEFLLKKGANVNRVNRSGHGPIHLATVRACKTGKFEVLDILLNESTINLNLEAIQQTALHLAVREKNLKCARRLLEKGASPNIPDSKGLTALHLAAKQKQRDMVQLIMEQTKHALYLEYKDWKEQTAREVLEENFPDIQLPHRQGVNVYDLKYYLNAHDEIHFLKSLDNVDEKEVNREAESLIELAVENNFPNLVAALLKRTNGAERNLENAASLAISRGSPNILRQLLDTDLNVKSNLLMDACIALGTPEQKGFGTMEERIDCLKMILSKNVDVRCTDSKKSTPLHYAVSADCPEAIMQLLKKGSYIGQKNDFDVLPITDIPVSILSDYFDDCVQFRRGELNEYKIEFDYKCLMPNNPEFYMESQDKNFLFSNEGTREMDVFRYIAGNKNVKQLLTHPLLSSFLYLKWHRIRYILYLNFVFYLIFYILLNAYILRTTYMKDAKTNFTEVEGETEESSVYVLRIFASIALGLLAVRESLQLLSSPREYIWSLENWIEMILIIFGFITLYDGNIQVVAMTILLSAWELVILIGKHPRMSTSIEMFKKVSLNFTRFFFFYAFLILAFALAFFTLFKDGDDFPDPGHSLFKTIIMLTGEFEAGDIPFTAHPVFSHFIFVLFVFLIAIVLFNLLIGLAVSDTAEILHEAELVGLISRIEVLAYIENIACGAMYPWKFNLLACLVGKVLLFPSYLRSGKLTVKLYNNVGASNRMKHKIWIAARSEDKELPTFEMDPSVIKKAKNILSKRQQQTDNEKLFSIMNKLEKRFDAIETALNYIKERIENNVNVANGNKA